MVTSPEACPTCKGSRRILKLNPHIDDLPGPPSLAKMHAGIGFERATCPTCDGGGSLVEQEPAGEYPPAPRSKAVTLEMSEDQERAVDEVLDWFHESPDKRKSLAGLAGTGKTTIIAELLRRLKGKCVIRVCALAGKAAAVLRSKGVDASTLHKLIYAPETVCTRCMTGVKPFKPPKGKPRCPDCETQTIKTNWVRVPIIEADLVIVDEASMLNLSIVKDIEELTRKILYVGDHGQLEPIGEDPKIMREPDIRLEKIHRQAAHSGIIQLAHHVRVGSHPQKWDGSGYADARVVGLTKLIPRTLARFDIVLCGYNKTRKDVNAAIRKFRGFSGQLPEAGERLVCLQNDSDLDVLNGLLVTVIRKVKSYEYPRYDLIDDSGREYHDIMVHPDQFVEEKKLEYINKGIGVFDFGYCLTVHKAQGSEWDSVAVIEQIARSWDPARWRYTAITRAAKNLEYWLPLRRM